MNKQEQSLLLERAFLWFQEQYRKTPHEAGMDVVIPRVRRICFFKTHQVVFAPDKNIANAFDQGQTILEWVINGVMAIMMFIICTVPYFSLYMVRHNMADAFIILKIDIFLGLLCLIALHLCYVKAKPLEKAYDKVIIYTE